MQLHVFEIKFNSGAKEDALYPVILQNQGQMVLIDCGYAGFLPLIEQAAQQQGISLQQLTGVLITHHDIDHMGGLHEIKAKYPSVKIYALDIEKQYVNGKEKSLRLQQAEKVFPTLPESQKPGALYFQEMLRNVQPVEVDETLQAGESIPFMSGVEVIHTPSHMPGHISLYIPASKTLIAADAVVYQDSELEIANPAFTLDLKEAVASVKKIQQLDVETLVCYHGGIVTSHIQEQLAALLARYPFEI